MLRRPVIERFLEKIAIRENGCWEWQGAKYEDGYGMFWDGVKLLGAHRYSYEYFNGYLPQWIAGGKEIDHLCRNRCCANPNHLELVDQRENIIRGINPSLLRKRMLSITHCPQGHEYTIKNTRITNKGYRQCRTCEKIYKKRYLERQALTENKEEKDEYDERTRPSNRR